MREVLKCVCDESERYDPVERTVYEMEFTRENLHKLWEKTSKFPILFSEPVDNFDDFANIFLSHDVTGFLAKGLVWVIDDFVGIYYLTNIILNTDALVHYSFFDKKHVGRSLLSLRMLQYAFRNFGFERLTVEIPLYAKEFSFDFIRSLGFVAEGRKRRSCKYKDTWFDKKLFGITKNECLALEVPVEIEHLSKVSAV